MNFWEDNYRVEEDGRVFSFTTNKYLKFGHHRDGYLNIKLHIDGKSKMMLIHRLVALTYIPNEDNQPEVDHIDRDKTNNHFTNLRWVSHTENQQNKDLGISGERNISFGRNNYRIQFFRNKIRYGKYISVNGSLQDAIQQRDIMLSMF